MKKSQRAKGSRRERLKGKKIQKKMKKSTDSVIAKTLTPEQDNTNVDIQEVIETMSDSQRIKEVVDRKCSRINCTKFYY